jgi:hypothetical protein
VLQLRNVSGKPGFRNAGGFAGRTNPERSDYKDGEECENLGVQSDIHDSPPDLRRAFRRPGAPEPPLSFFNDRDLT